MKGNPPILNSSRKLLLVQKIKQLNRDGVSTTLSSLKSLVCFYILINK
jgi:hypothetical protein